MSNSNHVGFPSTEELVTGYAKTNNYIPLFSAFANQKRHEAVMGKATTTVIRSVGDLTAPKMGPTDTERKQIITDKVAKDFKKEYFPIQYLVSEYQNKDHVQDLSNRVLDRLLEQQDKNFAQGVHNDGCFVSSDPDWIQESPVALTEGDFTSLYNAVQDALDANEQLVGNGPKEIWWYGDARGFVNSVLDGTDSPMISLLAKQFSQISFRAVPIAATPDNTHGFFVVNQGLVQLQLTEVAGIKTSGYDQKDLVHYINYVYGTMRLNILERGGFEDHPVTIS